MDVSQQVISVLGSVLNLGSRASAFDKATPLLGAVPELDSMAVVSVLTGLEETFGFSIDDDEIDSSTFATVGHLVAFVERKLY